MILPLVSVIIPVYNTEKYLNKSIPSILDQTYKNIEIIIVNDGSTDRSDEKIKNYIYQDQRVIYCKQKNRGPSAARNAGIEISSGEFIIFVDADDTVEKEYVEKLVTAAIKFNHDIVSCGYTEISIHGNIKLNDFWDEKTDNSKEQFIINIFQGVGGTLWGKVFKREIILKHNLRMNPEINMCEDMVFVLQYATHCVRCGSIKESLYNYNRLNENSITAMLNLKHLESLIIVIKRIEEVLKMNTFDTKQIDSILSMRVQGLIESFVIQQHNCKYSKRKKIDNMKLLFENKYYIKYEKNLPQTSINSRILFYLIRMKDKNLIYYYGFILCLQQQIKDILKLKLYKNQIRAKRLIFEEGIS
ncbi:glycosyltransferase family 2 protein [Bacillus sp. OK048]|uniref:glycosyltransferase family 2 protein n=1 Tax=Bacillus sp. OK048 TaxID=1882761 RepID=UPI000886DD99|nr:glycosyltransferase family 2 protein [Bacillus sp. OK048]SDM78159.1 Glycosyl transferase family 2 [Bacillus sp. OK048]